MVATRPTGGLPPILDIDWPAFWEAEFEAFLTRARACGARVGLSAVDAEDLAHDVVASCLGKVLRGDPAACHEAARAYAHRALDNRIRDWRRKRRRRRTDALTPMVDETVEQAFDRLAQPSPPHDAVRRDEWSRLMLARTCLADHVPGSDADRASVRRSVEAVFAHRIDHLSYRALAASFAARENTVRKWVSRGRLLLSGWMSAFGYDHPVDCKKREARLIERGRAAAIRYLSRPTESA